jgi:hypothetical protein
MPDACCRFLPNSLFNNETIHSIWKLSETLKASELIFVTGKYLNGSQ